MGVPLILHPSMRGLQGLIGPSLGACPRAHLAIIGGALRVLRGTMGASRKGIWGTVSHVLGPPHPSSLAPLTFFIQGLEGFGRLALRCQIVCNCEGDLIKHPTFCVPFASSPNR
ncbi:hypothetical protein KP509_32G024200 [Ceratopteris richardii]|uniref:Uncharacterized protein n=1 Tax=Ceratopteris richardii TaxID=49495 RepID=A0A8T2QTB4_CERRI|nr:hypothetical protein KP509_32G024200 [Ceratopteris richardii]